MPAPAALSSGLALVAAMACLGRPERVGAPRALPTAASAWVLVRAGPVQVGGRPVPRPNLAAFESELRGLALCYPAIALVTDDGGETWREAQLPLTTGALNAIELHGATAWTAGGVSLRVSSDAGQTWRELPQFGSTYTLPHLSFLDARVGWYAFARDGAPRLALTRDGGSTWTPVTAPVHEDDEIMAISLASERAGFVLLSGGILLRTNDGGAHWTELALPSAGRRPVSTNSGAPVEAMRFSDDRHGTLVRYFEQPRGFMVFDTADGGKTWMTEELPSDRRPRLGTVFLSRDRTVLTLTDLEAERVLVYRRNGPR